MSRGFTSLCFGLTMAIPLILGPAYAGDVPDEKPPAPPSISAQLKGTENVTLKKDLKTVSQLLSGNARPDSTPRQINWQAAEDRKKMLRVLNAHGYFSGTIDVQMVATQTLFSVIFTVAPGRQYRLHATTIHSSDAPPDLALETFLPRPKRNVKSPPATAGTILQKEAGALRSIRSKGYPFARLQGRSLAFVHDMANVELHIELELGEKATFGALTIQGLDAVKTNVIHRYVGWEHGDLYDDQTLRKLESDLLNSGLFATVRCTHTGTVTPAGDLPIRLEVRERKHRTVRTGLKFSSDTGWGVILGWEHRNLRGRGDRLNAYAELSEIGQEGDVTFTRNLVHLGPLEFQFKLTFGEEDTDAYDNYATEISSLFEYRPFTDVRLVSGLGYRHTEVRQLGEEDTFELAILPVLVEWDRRDDLLDPKKGFRLYAGASRNDDMISTLSFTKTTLVGSFYLTSEAFPSTTLAARVDGSDIQGASSSEIPADSKLYAGGANSVRGYGFQSIGAVVDGTPLGGTRRFTGSLELRQRGRKNLGGVLFVDAGAVSEEEIEDDTLRYSAGVGLRYFTGMGPLRFDIAFPIDKRDGIDDTLQLYVSIGQFF